MLHSEGLLREGICHAADDANWAISFGLVSLSLPASALNNEEDFAAFLRRKIGANAVSTQSSWVRSLLDLFDQQGCIISSSEQLVSAGGIARLHAQFSNWWYARYYSHPIWERLRGDLDAGLFASWASRTYYLSKSAGATAARSAARSPRREVRRAFKKSCIEEYGHHREFYALSPLLEKIGQRAIAGRGPTLGCVAFDDHMLAIAGSDDLAHVFVALFQEKTAEFCDAANDFYDSVEHRLDIPGALAGWRTHISFDHEHGHASDLSELFSAFDGIPIEDLKRSLLRASATIDFLVESLSEVDCAASPLPVQEPSRAIRAEILSGLAPILAEAMSHCTEAPGDLIAFGKVLEEISKTYPFASETRMPERLGAAAVLARLEHIAAQTNRFKAALASLLRYIGEQALLQSLGAVPERETSVRLVADDQAITFAISAWDRPIHCFALEEFS